MGKNKGKRSKKRWSSWEGQEQETQKYANDLSSDPIVYAEVESLFKKQFTYAPPGDKEGGWVLPSVENWFRGDAWSIDELQKNKEALNLVKSSLSFNDIEEWHTHTSFTNRAGSVINHVRRTQKPEVCTQAWCKFHEIVATFPILLQSGKAVEPPDVATNTRVQYSGTLADVELRTAHLCEAPGAFISSLNHFLKTRCFCGSWWWMANTLNPYYEGNNLTEMINDDRLILDTLDQWYFGTDDSGDILHRENVDGIRERIAESGKVNLVTCDGSIDCQNTPGEQEELVAPLHFAEVTASLQLLGPKGSLVLKMFTLFESSSVCLLYWLNCLFTTVHVFKPATSKAGNSEVYVVCIGYKGCNTFVMDMRIWNAGIRLQASPMLNRSDIPNTFITQHLQCCEFFLHLQVQTIQENISLYSCLPVDRRRHLCAVKQHCAASFVDRFQIRPLPGQAYLVPPFHTKSGHGWLPNHQVRTRSSHTGSYTERQTKLHLTWFERILAESPYEPPLDEPGILQGFSVLSMEDSDLKSWPAVIGKVPDYVVSSQFCDQTVLAWYNDLLQHYKNEQAKILDYSKLRKCIETMLKIPTEEDEKQPIKLTQLDHSAGTFLEHLRQSENFRICTNRSDYGGTMFVSELAGGNVLGHSWWSSSVELFRSLYTMYKAACVGDSCVVLLPDLLTRLNAGIFYLLYISFTQVSVRLINDDGMSPVAVVCHSYQCENSQSIQVWLRKVIEMVTSPMEKYDLLQLTPMHVLFESQFYTYVCEANETLLKLRCNTMLKQQQGTYNAAAAAQT